MKKTIHLLWSAFVLVTAVLIVASATSLFMMGLAFPVGVPMAVAGSSYWFNVWLGFDKLCNAALGGDHKETVSSRLGKSVIWRYSPVFFNRKIDKTVSWMLSQVDPNHCEKSIDWNVGEIFPPLSTEKKAA